jgi:AcrR family transcriptional regulator
MTEFAPVAPEPGARPRSARYEQRREKIIDVTSALLNEKGVWGMTLLEVAQALDLTTTSVTYYYRYKEQLAAAAFEDTMDRLDAMTAEAAKETTARERVRRYIEIHFEHFARALRGETRPLVILSELRALEDSARARLIGRYQIVFRNTRALFGPADTPERKRAYTARAQVLNEALFWAAIWLRRYPISAFAHVARRVFDVLEQGIAVPGTVWEGTPVDPDIGKDRDPKREFLQVATRLINDIGYRGASVERIVSELNITKGSFYHHLDAKDELILDCFRDGYRRLAQMQQMIEEQPGTIWARIANLIASALALQFDGSYPLLRTTALLAMPTAVRVLAIERYERFTLALSGAMADGMAEGSVRMLDPLIASHVTLSTINSAYDLRGWARRQDRDQAIARYGATLLNGLFDPVPGP